MLRALLVTSAFIALATTSTQAAVIGPGPAPTLGVTVAPGNLGSDFPAFNQGGFQDSGVNTHGGTLPSWASIAYRGPGAAGGFGSYSGTQYSTLTVGSVTGNPGVVFEYGPNNGSNPPGPAQLATITLAAGAPSSFTLGFLEGVTDNGSENTPLTITSGSSTQTVNSPAVSRSKVNDFYFVSVTGAAAGDTITVSGFNTTTSNAALGGITFSSVPEPTSIGILAAASTLVSMRRKRKA